MMADLNEQTIEDLMFMIKSDKSLAVPTTKTIQFYTRRNWAEELFIAAQLDRLKARSRGRKPKARRGRRKSLSS